MAAELAEDLAAKGHAVTVITGFPNHPEGVLYPGWRRRWLAVEQQGSVRVARSWHLISRSRRTVPRSLSYLSFALTSFLNSLRLGPFDLVYADSTPIFGHWTAWPFRPVQHDCPGCWSRLRGETQALLGVSRLVELYRSSGVTTE